jgi:hypothetical protein
VSRFRRLTARRTGARAGIVAVIVGVLTGGYFVVSALAAPTIPAPTITGSPTNPTSATTATFTYTDSQPGASFICSLDGAAFSYCPRAGAFYTHLSNGSHSFAVEATSGASTSAPKSYAWVVDTTGPAITLTFPVANHEYNTAAWAAGCSPAGICGTAADSQGVKSVGVAIYQESSDDWWNGSSFSSITPVFSHATGTTSWHYGFTPPANGLYEVVVDAQDNLGNISQVRADFSYDTVAPPAPVFTKKPTNPSKDTSPEFEFADRDWPRVTFWCSLDSGMAQPCTGDTDHDGDRFVEGELHLHNLSPGSHCFSVYARDEAGNDSPATKYCWTITGNSTAFTVSGSLTSPLYPGVSEPLDLTITNPGSSAITIAAGGVGSSNITITSNQAGCASSNFEVSQALTAAVTIPAGQTKSLSDLSVPQADWPVITMINTNSNQDACEGATLTLTYSGIEATG